MCVQIVLSPCTKKSSRIYTHTRSGREKKEDPLHKKSSKCGAIKGNRECRIVNERMGKMKDRKKNSGRERVKENTQKNTHNHIAVINLYKQTTEAHTCTALARHS